MKHFFRLRITNLRKTNVGVYSCQTRQEKWKNITLTLRSSDDLNSKKMTEKNLDGYQSDTNYLTEDNNDSNFNSAAPLSMTENNAFNFDLGKDVVIKIPRIIYEKKLGDSAEFPCPNTNITMLAKVTWRKENSMQTLQNVRNGVLEFDQLHSNDTGVYTCSSGIDSYSISLFVYNKNNKIYIILHNSTVISGSIVMLSCSNYLSPEQGVTWKKHISETEDIVVQTSEKSLPQLLIFQPFTKAEEGLYTCYSDAEPNKVKNSINITVLEGKI